MNTECDFRLILAVHLLHRPRNYYLFRRFNGDLMRIESDHQRQISFFFSRSISMSWTLVTAWVCILHIVSHMLINTPRTATGYFLAYVTFRAPR